MSIFDTKKYRIWLTSRLKGWKRKSFRGSTEAKNAQNLATYNKYVEKFSVKVQYFGGLRVYIGRSSKKWSEKKIPS